MEVARAHFTAASITPVDSFEAGADLVRSGAVESLIVPGAYPLLASFIMDPLLVARDVFLGPIVPLVLARAPESELAAPKTVYLHGATEALVPEAGLPPDIQRLHCVSNTEACRRAASDRESVAITNQPSASHFQMKVLKVLRVAINMPWILFSAAGTGQVRGK